MLLTKFPFNPFFSSVQGLVNDYCLKIRNNSTQKFLSGLARDAGGIIINYLYQKKQSKNKYDLFEMDDDEDTSESPDVENEKKKRKKKKKNSEKNNGTKDNSEKKKTNGTKNKKSKHRQ